MVRPKHLPSPIVDPLAQSAPICGRCERPARFVRYDQGLAAYQCPGCGARSLQSMAGVRPTALPALPTTGIASAPIA